LPRTTRVSVPSHRSTVTHFVPRTVAELKRPRVRKRPLLTPQRRRLRRAAVSATELAEAPHWSFGPVSLSVVNGLSPPVWPTLNTPS
jgi:hypothetical protein